MEPAVYELKRCEILLTRYREQAANLRQINYLETLVFIAFVAIQLALLCWASSISPINVLSKVALIIIDLSLLGICLQLSTSNKQRRAEIRATIVNINEAFALYAADIYLAGRAINPPPRATPMIFFKAGYWASALSCIAVAIYISGR